MPTPSRLLVAREAEVADAYKGGATFREFEKRYRCSEAAIRRVLVAAGVPTRAAGQRPSKLKGHEAEVVAAYLAGATIEELAERNCCSRTPITRVLDEAGVQRRSRGSRRAAAGHEAAIAGRYRAGATLQDLSVEFGSSAKTIRQILVEAGVTIRRVGPR